MEEDPISRYSSLTASIARSVARTWSTRNRNRSLTVMSPPSETVSWNRAMIDCTWLMLASTSASARARAASTKGSALEALPCEETRASMCSQAARTAPRAMPNVPAEMAKGNITPKRIA